MRFISVIIFFIGYSLVYAPVANGGVFTAHPWFGVLGDAYTDPPSTSSADDTTTTPDAPTTSTASSGTTVRGRARTNSARNPSNGASGNLGGFGK